MKARFVLIIMGYLAINCEGFDIFKILKPNEPDSYMNSMQFIRKYGYPAEAHSVKTSDGYLLQMHRIPHGKNSSTSSKRPPVFLQHGIFGSSFDFLVIGSEKGLAFLLAKMGYDVWLGNARGNTYSRAHVTLTPQDSKFWDFTWHESAIYDLPAEIDYILNHTRHEKIIYMGYSMGTTMFLVLTSMLPQYNEKIEASMLMAVAGYLDHMRSPLLKIILPIFPQLTRLVQILTNGKLLAGGELTSIVARLFCDLNYIERTLCTSAVSLLSGGDFKGFNQSLITLISTHFPSGYSVKAVQHYYQILKSKKFQYYDYGKSENEQRYGSITPPEYPVERITVPMYFYEGENDYLSNIPDVKRLAKRLKTLKRFDVVKNPEFSHLSFLVSSDVKKQLYDTILNDLKSNTENALKSQ